MSAFNSMEEKYFGFISANTLEQALGMAVIR